MKRFYTVLVPLLAASAAILVLIRTGCIDVQRPSQRDAARVQRSAPAQAPRTAAELLAHYASEVDSRFRLRPDARFVGAFLDLERLLTGQAPDAVTTRFEQGRWTLESGGRTVARDLPELPSFADWLAALDARAAELSQDQAAFADGELAVPPAARERLAAWHDAPIANALGELDVRWRAGDRRAADLATCVRGLAQLSLLLVDDLQLADSVGSRALAALVLARRIDPERVLRDEILIAYALDYSRHAAERARELEPGDPVAALARGDDAALAALAQAADAPRESRYFLGLALAHQARPQAWARWYRSLPTEEQAWPLSVRTARLAPDVQILNGMTTTALFASVWTFAPDGPKPTHRTIADPAVLAQSRKVQLGIEQAARPLVGPWLDAGLYRDFHRAYWLSAIYQRGMFHLEARGTLDDAAKFADALDGSDDPDVRVLHDWYAPLANPRRSDPDRLRRTLRAPSILGPLQREATLERLMWREAASEHKPLELLSELAQHLDARPGHLLHAADLSRAHYQDLALEERLDAAALAADAPHQPWRAARRAGQSRDTAELWEMARSPSEGARRMALAELATQADSDVEQIEALYAREWPARRDESSLVVDYAAFLSQRRQQHTRAADVIRDYLSRNEDGSLGAAEMHRRLSFYLRRAGSASAAWDAIEPALESEKRSVLDEGVQVLVELGHLDRAEDLARRMHKRYPQMLSTSVALATTLWQRGELEAAADVLREAERSAALEEQRELVSRAFADTFAKAPLERTLAAYERMIAVQLDTGTLLECIPVLHARGAVEASVELTQRLRAPERNFEVQLLAYLGMRKLRGDAQAMQWLVDRVGPSELNRASPALYRLRQEHLLWDAFALTQTPPDATTWRWRAAAAARGAPLTPEQRLELERYYTNPSRNFDDRIGQMLIGVASEQQLLADAHDVERLCQAAWAIAIRAIGQGRYREGARWLQIAIATQSRDTREYGLALDARDELAASGKTLALLEHEHASGGATTADAAGPDDRR